MCFFDTKEEAYAEEAFIVNQEWINRKDTYNANLGGNVNRTFKGQLKRENHGFSKKVINTETGEIYDSIATVSEMLGVTQSCLSKQLKGEVYNPTPFQILNKSENHKVKESPNNIIYTDLKRYDDFGNFICGYKYINELPTSMRANLKTVFSNPKGGRQKVDGSYWTAYNLKTKSTEGEIKDRTQFVGVFPNGDIKFFSTTKDMLLGLGYSGNSSDKVKKRINKYIKNKGDVLLFTKDYYDKYEDK